MAASLDSITQEFIPAYQARVAARKTIKRTAELVSGFNERAKLWARNNEDYAALYPEHASQAKEAEKVGKEAETMHRVENEIASGLYENAPVEILNLLYSRDKKARGKLLAFALGTKVPEELASQYSDFARYTSALQKIASGNEEALKQALKEKIAPESEARLKERLEKVVRLNLSPERRTKIKEALAKLSASYVERQIEMYAKNPKVAEGIAKEMHDNAVKALEGDKLFEYCAKLIKAQYEDKPLEAIDKIEQIKPEELAEAA